MCRSTEYAVKKELSRSKAISFLDFHAHSKNKSTVRRRPRADAWNQNE